MRLLAARALRCAPHDARSAARSAVRHHEHLAPHLGEGKHCYDLNKVSLVGLSVSLQVSDGQLMAVVGRVGAGKSSLVSAILGEMEKIGGSVSVRVSRPHDDSAKTDTLLDTYITFYKSKWFIANCVKFNHKKTQKKSTVLLSDGTQKTNRLITWIQSRSVAVGRGRSRLVAVDRGRSRSVAVGRGRSRSVAVGCGQSWCGLAGLGGVRRAAGVDPERERARQHPVRARVRREALRRGAGRVRPPPRPRHPAGGRPHRGRREGRCTHPRPASFPPLFLDSDPAA